MIEIPFRLCLDQGFGDEKGIEIEKVDDPIVLNGWIIELFHFHFLLPHHISDPNTALKKRKAIVYCLSKPKPDSSI